MKNEIKQYVFTTEHNKENPYTLISNGLIDDVRLSPEAILIMLHMLRGYNNKRFYIKTFSNSQNLNKKRVQIAMNELIAFGYCIKNPINKRKIEYYFYEVPLLMEFEFNDRWDKNDPLIIRELNSENLGEGINLTLRRDKNDPLIITNIITNIESKGELEIIEDVSELNFDKNIFNNTMEIESNKINFEENKNTQVTTFKTVSPLSKIKIESNRVTKTKKINTMLKIISLQNKDLIQNEFKLMDEYQQLSNNDTLFDKWYNFKLTKNNPDEKFTLTQYWSGFLGFVKKDSEISSSKLKSKYDVEVKKTSKAPYCQADIDAYHLSPVKLKSYIDSTYFDLSDRFICNIDRVMIFLLLKILKYDHKIKFQDFLNIHISLMKKYQQGNGIRVYNMDSLTQLYLKEHEIIILENLKTEQND